MRARVAARSESLMSGVGPIVMFVAERRRGEFGASVKRAHTCAVARRHSIPSRARSLYSPMRIFYCDTAAQGGAPVEADPFPNRLRPTFAYSRPATRNSTPRILYPPKGREKGTKHQVTTVFLVGKHIRLNRRPTLVSQDRYCFCNVLRLG